MELVGTNNPFRTSKLVGDDRGQIRGGRAIQPRGERTAMRQETDRAQEEATLIGLVETAALGNCFGDGADVVLLPIVHTAAQGRRRSDRPLVENLGAPSLLGDRSEVDEASSVSRRCR